MIFLSSPFTFRHQFYSSSFDPKVPVLFHIQFFLCPVEQNGNGMEKNVIFNLLSGSSLNWFYILYELVVSLYFITTDP